MRKKPVVIVNADPAKLLENATRGWEARINELMDERKDWRNLAMAAMPHLSHSEVADYSHDDLYGVIKRELDDRKKEIDELRRERNNLRDDRDKFRKVSCYLLGLDDGSY